MEGWDGVEWVGERRGAEGRGGEGRGAGMLILFRKLHNL